MSDLSVRDLKSLLEEAKREIDYYRRLAQEAGTLRLRETEQLSGLVSELRQTRQYLDEERSRYRTLADLAPYALFVISSEDRLTYTNPNFIRMFGYGIDEIPTGQDWFLKAFPDDNYRLQVIAAWNEDIANSCTSEQHPRIFNVTCKDGQERLVRFHVAAFQSSEYMVTCEDITDRKRMETAILDNVNNFLCLFETIDDLIIVATPNQEILHINSAVSHKLGYSAEEVKALGILGLHSEGKREEASKIFGQMLNSERSSCPLPLKKKNGELLPVETRIWFGQWSGADCIFGICKDLSKEQEALQKFDRLFYGNPAPMAVSSFPERKFTEVNDAFVSAMGFSREEVIGKSGAELGLFSNPETLRKVDQSLQEEGRVKPLEVQMRRKDGGLVDGLFQGEIIDSQGRKSFLSMMLDITDRARAEKELARKQSLLQGLLDSIPDLVFFKDMNGAYLGCNREFASYVGSECQDIIGHTDYDLFDKSVADFFRENDRLMMAQESARHNEEWIEYPDGRHRLVDTHKAPLRLSTGETIGILGVSRDITEARNTQKALLESEQRYRSLFEGSRDGIVFTDMEGRIEAFNTSYKDMLGYTAEELLSRTYIDFTPAKWLGLEERIVLEQIVRRGYSDLYEKEYICKDGRVIPVELNTFIVRRDGKNIGMWAVVRDITERKKSEEKLRASEQNFKIIVENVAIPMAITVGKRETVEYLNPKFTDLFGYTVEDTQEIADWWPLAYPDEQYRRQIVSEWTRLVDTATTSRKVTESMETMVTCRDGSQKGIEWRLASIGDKNVIFGIDITDRQRWEQQRLEMERKLLHAQKLESLGIMAGGIAHDFNNLLQVVLGNLELALEDLPTDSEAHKSIRKAIKASERSAELSTQMLTYSGSSVHLPQDVNIPECLNKLLDSLQSSVSRNVVLSFDIDKAVPLIKGESDQIQSLIRNIVINASEAIGDNGGVIRVSIGVMDCDETCLSQSRIEIIPEPGRFVFLEISDTGSGMDDNTLYKLFDPFFTTKFWGRGLGMAEVMGIVRSHRGAITVESEVAKGTTIRVLFPVSQAVQATPVQAIDVVESKVPARENVTESKMILVVEDEDMVRGMVVKRLRVLGYDAITASDGEEGVRIFREHMNEIALVLLDFAMPRMNGIEAFGELIKIKPDVKVILSSGYTEEAVLKNFPDRRPAGVLHKPYKMEDLKIELERFLGN